MRVAVLGCGAIGGTLLAYLTKAGVDVIGVVKDYQKSSILGEGLKIEGVRGDMVVHPRIDTRMVGFVDVAIIATKIDDIEAIVKDNLDFLKPATIVTTQNGIKADEVVVL